MCFSDHLDHDACGYLMHHGHVLVGYKTVIHLGADLLMPVWPMVNTVNEMVQPWLSKELYNPLRSRV